MTLGLRRSAARQLFTFVLMLLALTAASRAEAFEVGDRVEVVRGLEWARGTIVAFDEARGRYSVRLDDDGSLDNMSAEQKEKRLTRNYFPSQMRAVRGADNPPAVTPAPTTPPPPSTEDSPRGRSPSTRGASRPSSRETSRELMLKALESHTWSDKSGRFKVEATYRGMNGEKVILEKADGTKIEVELAKLSEGDQFYVEALQMSMEADPFAPPPGISDSAPPVARSAGEEASLEGVKRIESKAFKGWTFKPERSAATAAPGGQKQKIKLSALPDSDPFHERIEALDVSADGTRAFVVRKAGSRGLRDRIFVDDVDLTSGLVLGAAALPAGRELLAISAEFGLVVWKPSRMAREESLLGFGRIEGGQLTTLSEFVPPFPGRERGSAFAEADNAWIVGPQQVMVGGFRPDSQIVWDVVARRALWDLPVGGVRDSSLVTSDDGRYLAVYVNKGIGIIDLHQGKHVATFGVPDGIHLSSMRFSDDNSRLLVQDSERVAVVDLMAGKLLYTYAHPTMSSFKPIDFLGPFLVHQSRYVYDPNRRILLWEFSDVTDHKGTYVTRGGRVVGVERPEHGSNAIYLRTAPVPMSDITALAQTLGDYESLIVAKRGDKIAIDVEVDASVANDEEIYAAIAKNLQAVGLEVVVENVPLVLKAYCKQGPTESVEIHQPDAQGLYGTLKPTTHTITPWITYISLTLNGEEVDRAGSRLGPIKSFAITGNNTVEQAIANLETPRVDFLKTSSVKLPVLRDGNATASGAFGSSSIGE